MTYTIRDFQEGMMVETPDGSQSQVVAIDAVANRVYVTEEGDWFPPSSLRPLETREG